MPPRFVQWQQALTDGGVNRIGRGAVVEEVKLSGLASIVMGFVFDKHAPDEWGDGHDGIRHRE